jgi:hypothetical protein
MKPRAARLARLVRLQEQIKALHQTRHATHLSRAGEARQEAVELVEALGGDSPMPGLFPELYNRRIENAVAREADSMTSARAEADNVVRATARTHVVTRAYDEARRLEDRHHSEKEQLESVERGLKRDD